VFVIGDTGIEVIFYCLVCLVAGYCYAEHMADCSMWWANKKQNSVNMVPTYHLFLDPEGGSPRATVVVLVFVVISSLKIPKAFLIRSTTKLCIHIFAHIPYRSFVSDFKINL